MSNIIPSDILINANDAGKLTGILLNNRLLDQFIKILTGIKTTANSGYNIMAIHSKIDLRVIDELRRAGYVVETPETKDIKTTYIKWEIDGSNNVINGCLIGVGPTGDRPIEAGQGSSYLDTDLGYVVWYFEGKWINASGAEE